MTPKQTTAEHGRLAEATGRAEDGSRYERLGDDLRDGLFVSLAPWHWHLFDVAPLDPGTDGSA